MTSTLTPQIRILALVGLVAAAAVVVSTQLIFRGVHFSAESDPATARATQKAQAVTDTAAAAKQTDKAAAATNTARTAKSLPATRTKTDAATKRPARTHGLPMPLARALENNRVVVVSLFTRGAAVDRLSRAEAEAGAREVGAGFVALNVLDRTNSEALAAKFGVVKAPSVLVYTRPAKLFVKFDGFADVATVAQAAANARP